MIRRLRPIPAPTRPARSPVASARCAAAIAAALAILSVTAARAACPPGDPHPITSGDPAAGPVVVLGGLGPAPAASFFLLGAGDQNNSGGLLPSDWLHRIGDVDGDGLPDYAVLAPGDGPGGWSDPRAAGCPSAAVPPRPPVVLLVHHVREDLDGDGKFDVFEDFVRGNGVLDPGEDIDRDGRLTPPGGCEGVLREDIDCDGRLDFINEDMNGNGGLDPGEDLDADGRLDPGTEDRNHNQMLDDRTVLFPDDHIPDPNGDFTTFYPYGAPRPATGGALVVSLAWNGAAYDLAAITTPTFPAGPGAGFRVLRAGPLDRLLPRVSGAHNDPQGALRLHLAWAGLDLADDAPGARAVFDHLALMLDAPAPYGTPLFVESGAPSLTIPASGNLAAAAFGSIAGMTVPYSMIGIGLMSEGRSAGSDALLAEPGRWPPAGLHNLLDADGDGTNIPYDLCPSIPNSSIEDANNDGIGDACDPALDPAARVPGRWVEAPVAPSPGPRSGAAMVFDEDRGVAVLFGGSGDSSTWEYSGLTRTWRQVVTATAPAPRRGHRMVYDHVRRRVVLYGGVRLADGMPLADHWEYNGATRTWRRPLLRLTPGPRSDFGLAGDALRNQLVLFGGRNGDRALGDTWVFRGGVWRRLPSPRSPSPRHGAAMAWDGTHGVVLLQGGSAGPGPAARLNDLWAFDGSSWQPVDYAGDVPPTTGAILMHDAARRQMILVGGLALKEADVMTPGAGGAASVVESPTAATRVYDGFAFAGLPTRDTLAARTDHAAAFDGRRGMVVVQGGSPLMAVILQDTVELARPADIDGDGVEDALDDCPARPNPGQEDLDADGTGDACDLCPAAADPAQGDRDRDGMGDACDPDRDGDGVANGDDACPDAHVAGRAAADVLGGGGPDGDGDGTPDDCDLCPRDAADDSDGDGVCGDRDNCPTVPNAPQADANGDGAGDACQPVVRINSIAPLPAFWNGLNALVTLRDPDRDPLRGRILVDPATVLPEILAAGIDPCAAALLPDGVAGEGIVFAWDPAGGTPLLADVDANVGCADGVTDFELSLGTCADNPAGTGTSLLVLDRPAPFPICVRRIGGAATGFDLRVERLTPAALTLTGIGDPLASFDYAGRLPFSVDIGGLPAPGPFVLRITATDGATPEVSDQRLFEWGGQRRMYFNLPIKPVAPAF